MTNLIIAKKKEALEAHHTLSEVTNNKATQTYSKVRKAAELLKSAGESMTFLRIYHSLQMLKVYPNPGYIVLFCSVLHTHLLN